MRIQIEVSARHLHLSSQDCLKLFGKAELKKRNNLSQPGEFAAEEVVEIAGPDKAFHKVRVLGPLRDKTQVELSFSDARHIGIEAPLALSGSGKGTEVKVVGPKGSFIAPVAMIAQRHIHLSTKSAKKLKLKDGKCVKVRVYGPRSLIFDLVMVRVSDDFRDVIHLDTDEGNAAGIKCQTYGELIIR